MTEASGYGFDRKDLGFNPKVEKSVGCVCAGNKLHNNLCREDLYLQDSPPPHNQLQKASLLPLQNPISLIGRQHRSTPCHLHHTYTLF